MKARDRSRKGVTRQQMKRPLCRYEWERRYLRKCNFLDGVGGGGKEKVWHPLLNHFKQLFALLRGIKARLILLHIH